MRGPGLVVRYSDGHDPAMMRHPGPERSMGETHREWLLVREADGASSHVQLGAPPLKIGRRPGHEVVLADTYASADHAELLSRQDQRWVQDLSSTNGTRLNGRPIPPRVLHSLHDGDVIRIGSTELTYHRQPAVK